MLKEKTPKTSWHKKRDIHKIAFEKVGDFVEEFIIKRKKCFLLSQLKSIYKDAYDSAAKKESVADNTILRNESFRFHLEERLLKHHPKKITMVIINNSKVWKSHSGVLLKDDDIDTLQKEDIRQKAAIILRDEIKYMQRRNLPDPSNATGLIDRKSDIPEIVLNFYNYILGDEESERTINDEDEDEDEDEIHDGDYICDYNSKYNTDTADNF
ncbi:hypothetical protein PV325_008892 [Microctonus aethiopoides]|uniref:Uncharacterized protein n=1 Tax=Microctonus aethiopoides TaxID=144406 RepID=A0AA39KXA2_9HYME|nr:hypothetical protein PV326_013337 [Microctonus aethiopoides]KAK0074013.1 hypothetical protein PV325_008892 [Microctonus aethiopoides]KAK0177160.1 hypothetical protein PV328_001239 [Microctonus aethiopoides]